MSKKTTRIRRGGSTRAGRSAGSPAGSPATHRPSVEGVTAPNPRPQISPSDAAKLRRGIKP